MESDSQILTKKVINMHQFISFPPIFGLSISESSIVSILQRVVLLLILHQLMQPRTLRVNLLPHLLPIQVLYIGLAYY